MRDNTDLQLNLKCIYSTSIKTALSIFTDQVKYHAQITYLHKENDSEYETTVLAAVAYINSRDTPACNQPDHSHWLTALMKLTHNTHNTPLPAALYQITTEFTKV